MDEVTMECCAQISVALQEQVVYWGQSKNKCDVAARVIVPFQLQPLLNKRAFCHLKPSTIYGEPEQEKPFVQLNNGAAGDNDFDEKRNSALLVLKHQTESRGEYEVLFKQCINDKRLSNLTLLEIVVTLLVGSHAITRVVPMVTYTHSKAITRASCRLIWYPTGERDSITLDDMLNKLAAYHRHHLDYEMQPSERNYYQSKLRAHKNVISYEEFYSLLGEWFVLAIKLAKKKKQYLWQQGEKSFVPMLINPARDDPTSILKEVGDFVIHIGEEMKSKKGSNSLPQILYPLQITYLAADGQVDCMGVESKLDKLNGFIHEKRCLAHYLVMEPGSEWARIKKEDFAFNAAQQRRWETTGGDSCVLVRGKGECASYAHAH